MRVEGHSRDPVEDSQGVEGCHSGQSVGLHLFHCHLEMAAITESQMQSLSHSAGR